MLAPPCGTGRPIPVVYEPHDAVWECYGDPLPPREENVGSSSGGSIRALILRPLTGTPWRCFYVSGKTALLTHIPHRLFKRIRATWGVTLSSDPALPDCGGVFDQQEHGIVERTIQELGQPRTVQLACVRDLRKRRPLLCAQVDLPLHLGSMVWARQATYPFLKGERGAVEGHYPVCPLQLIAMTCLMLRHAPTPLVSLPPRGAWRQRQAEERHDGHLRGTRIERSELLP